MATQFGPAKAGEMEIILKLLRSGALNKLMAEQNLTMEGSGKRAKKRARKEATAQWPADT